MNVNYLTEEVRTGIYYFFRLIVVITIIIYTCIQVKYNFRSRHCKCQVVYTLPSYFHGDKCKHKCPDQPELILKGSVKFCV